jgi:hypothetical protein
MNIEPTAPEPRHVYHPPARFATYRLHPCSLLIPPQILRAAISGGGEGTAHDGVPSAPLDTLSATAAEFITQMEEQREVCRGFGGHSIKYLLCLHVYYRFVM